MKNQRKVPPKFGTISSTTSEIRSTEMNSNKWRTIKLPHKTIEDLIASHLYAMRGMSRREIIDMGIPLVADAEGNVTIKIKLQEVNKPADHSGEKKNAEMAKRT
jgi:hypothetical protein